MKLCSDKANIGDRRYMGAVYAANGIYGALRITVPREDGTTVTQRITAGYHRYSQDLLTQVLPDGDLGLPGQWTAPWVEFDYTSANVLCIEQLTISNPVAPSISYDITEDWDPNAWDVVAADPGWESATGKKITHFAIGCNYDSTRSITQVSNYDRFVLIY